MRRGIASLWHASSLVLAGVLFFLFVLPRWFELTGQWPGALGSVLRIVCGVLVGLTALPVVLTLARTRKPELGTPALALSLRVWSIVGHLAAAVLIVGAAISEIWLDLDDVGQWLFGIYGAAAAITLLAAFAFYLAFVAELPPPPPKPLKIKTEKQSRRAAETTTEPQTEPETESASVEESAPDAEPDADTVDGPAEETPSDEGKLRNHRPSGKSRRGRTRGGVDTEN
jgi:MFS family permease